MKNIKLILLLALNSGFMINASDKLMRLQALSKQYSCRKCSSGEELLTCLQTQESKNLYAEMFKVKAETKNPTRMALEKKLCEKYINTPQDEYSNGERIQDCNIDRNDSMLQAWSKDFYEDETLTVEEKQIFGSLFSKMLLALHMGDEYQKRKALTENKYFEKYLEAKNDDEKDFIAHQYVDESIEIILSQSELDKNGQLPNFKGF